MQNEILEMVNQYNANVFASVKRLGDINTRTFEQLAAKQAEIMNDCLESSAKQYEVLTSAKDYKEALTAQGELVKSFNERYLAKVRETAEIMNAVREQLAGVVEEAVSYTSSNVEKVAKAASRKAG